MQLIKQILTNFDTKESSSKYIIEYIQWVHKVFVQGRYLKKKLYV